MSKDAFGEVRMEANYLAKFNGDAFELVSSNLNDLMDKLKDNGMSLIKMNINITFRDPEVELDCDIPDEHECTINIDTAALDAMTDFSMIEDENIRKLLKHIDSKK